MTAYSRLSDNNEIFNWRISAFEFKLLDKNYYINNSELIKKLSDYYESEIWEEIRILAVYDQQNWSWIQKQLHK